VVTITILGSEFLSGKSDSEHTHSFTSVSVKVVRVTASRGAKHPPLLICCDYCVRRRNLPTRNFATLGWYSTTDRDCGFKFSASPHRNVTNGPLNVPHRCRRQSVYIALRLAGPVFLVNSRFSLVSAATPSSKVKPHHRLAPLLPKLTGNLPEFP